MDADDPKEEWRKPGEISDNRHPITGQPTVLVSEFGQWMRKFLLVLLLILLVLLLVLNIRLGALDSFLHDAQSHRSKQICALLYDEIDTNPKAVAVYEDECGP